MENYNDDFLCCPKCGFVLGMYCKGKYMCECKGGCKIENAIKRKEALRKLKLEKIIKEI